jgi:hypothetical protein
MIASLSFAQVAIGKSSITSNSTSISLEFGAGNKGIILPWVPMQLEFLCHQLLTQKVELSFLMLTTEK